MKKLCVSLTLISVAVLAACGDSDQINSTAERPAPTATASPSPSGPTAHDELLAALGQLGASAFRFTVSGYVGDGQTIRASGVVSPKPRQYHVTTRLLGGKYPESIEQIVIGPDEFQRTPGDTSWVHLDLSRIKVSSLVYVDMDDPAGLARWTKSIADVQRTGPHAFKGTFAPDINAGSTVPLGTPTLTVFVFGIPPTFVATTDDAGRITSVTIEIKASGDKKPIKVTTKLSGYGTSVGVKAPAKSHVSEAEDFYYDS